MEDAIQFPVVFQALVAVEGFSAWKGRAFIGKPVANFDEGPMFDKQGFAELCNQLGDVSQLGKILWEMLKLYAKFKISRFRYLFVSKSKSFGMSLAKVVHNTLGFFLRCSPILSVPLLAICYIKQVGCSGNNVSHHVLSLVFWFIVAKILCYIFCATLNKIMVKDVSVKANAQNLMDIGKVEQ